ncbi:hypothetical protein BMS3Bbin04_01800 [bacterium BMS3Bbin04]|nr:hypothetical protein BMS3Bbin04_01800 [bacterium BMS3Bbin04]
MDAILLIFFATVPWIIWVLIYYFREMRKERG